MWADKKKGTCSTEVDDNRDPVGHLVPVYNMMEGMKAQDWYDVQKEQLQYLWKRVFQELAPYATQSKQRLVDGTVLLALGKYRIQKLRPSVKHGREYCTPENPLPEWKDLIGMAEELGRREEL